MNMHVSKHWFRPVMDESESSEELAETSHTDRDFSLEIAELAMVLGMKSLEDISFETALRSSAASTGNDFLFLFPAEKFPLDCSDAGCLRIRRGDDTKFCYVYRERPEGQFLIATEAELDADFIEFAHSFTSILLELKDTIGGMVKPQRAH